MRIHQAHVSESVKDFPVMRRYNMEPITDPWAPALFFGMYRQEDIDMLMAHRGLAVVRWCGQDALDCPWWKEIKQRSKITRHITPIPAVSRTLRTNGIQHKMIPPVYPDTPVSALPCGDNVYAYVPASCPQYHGDHLVDIIREAFPVIIGDGSVPRPKWDQYMADVIYSQCFAGVFLSRYAGGMGSIMEMGLRGIYVVSNVIEAPHVLPWHGIDDILETLQQLKRHIGTTNEKLACSVNRFCSHDLEFLDTEYYS